MRRPTEFTRLLFAWLNQVENDAELPASAFKIAWRLGQHFDRETLEGYPGSEHIADKTKLGKSTVLDMVRRLQAHGHIAISPGRPGRGHSHRYRMIIKGQQADLFDTDNNVRPAEHLSVQEKGRQADLSEDRKRSVYRSEKVGLHEIKGRPADMNHLREPLKRNTPSSGPTEQAAPLASKLAVRDIELAFEEWWKIYPLKVAKKGAKARYTAIVKRGEATIAELLAGAKAYTEAKTCTDPKFIKHPTTWLNNGCWADERPPAAKPNGPTPPNDDWWRERMKRYIKTNDWALPGPKPGQHGCRVPAHILAEFNISLH